MNTTLTTITERTNEPITGSNTAFDSDITNNLSSAERGTLMLVYALQGLGFFFGITFIAAVIVNYLQQDKMVSTVARSHNNFQVRTFWWSAIWTTLSFILIFVLIGYLTMFVAACWTLYRIVKGFSRLNNNEAI